MRLPEIRKEIYDYHRKYYPYLFTWPWYIYRRYKVIFFMEATSLLVFFLLKTPVTPNMITILYIFLGIFAGILLAISTKAAVFAAVVLLFAKPVLDWADGLLARIKNLSSVSGDVLDHYSPAIGWAFLWSGLGIYLGNSLNTIFFYLTPVLPSIFSADIYLYAQQRFILNYFSKPGLRTIDRQGGESAPVLNQKQGLLKKVKYFLDTFFQHDTKTVDIICLMLLLELIFPIHILWAYYILFLLWQAIVFISRMIIAYRGGWAETELERLKRNLYA